MHSGRGSAILSPYESLTVEDLIVADDQIKKKKKKSRNYHLLIPLNQECLTMAQALYLNISDINYIEVAYLKMWCEDPTSSYISLSSLLNLVPEKYYGFINSYFHETITYYQFFIFICLYSFFSHQQIFSVMMAQAKIYSNVLITKEQINSFYEDFHICKEDLLDLFQCLDSSHIDLPDAPSDAYSLKAFIRHFNVSLQFSGFLTSFKNEIIKLVFGVQLYNTISSRLFYYNHKAEFLSDPVESCADKFYRVIFTNDPPPYHYDYCPPLIKQKNAMDEVIYFIKQKYGYSSRKSSYNFGSFALILKKSSLLNNNTNVNISDRKITDINRFKYKTSSSGNYQFNSFIITGKSSSRPVSPIQERLENLPKKSLNKVYPDEK